MIDIKLLKDLYKINSKSGKEKNLVDFIINYVHINHPNVLIEIDDLNNIYITKGKSNEYPCLVSHTDQVIEYNGEIDIVRHNNIIIGFKSGTCEQANLGADDKNGVWIALQLLRSEPKIKIALFTGEETGCVGSSGCDMSFFDDVKYVIQCDRRNGGDFIQTAGSVELCPKDFVSKELMDKYGYSFAYGLMTDVQELKKRGLEVACCNLSCGYYNPHTEYECTDVKELINCLNFVKEIIKTTDKCVHKYVKPVYSSNYKEWDNKSQLSLYNYWDWECC